MKYVTAGEACSYFQISYMTLKRWRVEGKLQYKKFTDRKILYDIDSVNQPNEDNRQNVIYARVSTTSQKEQLENQIALIKNYMINNGIKPNQVYSEIGSGLNDNRLQLNKLLSDIFNNKIKSIYITYKDRLTRFGFDYFKFICSQFNTKLIVIDELENTDKDNENELVEDIISIIHHYSTKLYSNRQKQLKEIQNILKNNQDK